MSYDWVPLICPHCEGSGLAPSSDGRTDCGFCVRGVLTDELRDELRSAWAPILRRIARGETGVAEVEPHEH